MSAAVALELAPYGFRIRVEIDDGRAQILVDEGDGWEPAGEARVVAGPSVVKTVPTRKTGCSPQR